MVSFPGLLDEIVAPAAPTFPKICAIALHIYKRPILLLFSLYPKEIRNTFLPLKEKSEMVVSIGFVAALLD